MINFLDSMKTTRRMKDISSGLALLLLGGLLAGCGRKEEAAPPTPAAAAPPPEVVAAPAPTPVPTYSAADTAAAVAERLRQIEAAQKADVLIYGIGVRSEREQYDFGVLKKFAEETGGSFFSPRARFSEIQEAFRAIGEQIQGQYSLAYNPTDKTKDGSYRKIDIRCKVKGVRIRARKGYYAPEADS